MKILINQEIKSIPLEFDEADAACLILQEYSVRYTTLIEGDKATLGILVQKVTLDEEHMAIFLDTLDNIIDKRIFLDYAYGMVFQIELRDVVDCPINDMMLSDFRGR